MKYVMNDKREVNLMTISETVNVNLGDRSYDITIVRDLIKKLADFVPYSLEDRKIFIITDDNISEIIGTKVQEALSHSAAQDVHFLSLPAGETTKSWVFAERVTEWMLANNVDRHSVLFTVGGGVIGDLGGFAAAITMRGIDFVQIPTTLLAQVDSSVGGKTGIDTPQGKNLVGAFHQPVAVICDIALLETLPKREFLSGYAEIVKYAFLGDAQFFTWLDSNFDRLAAFDEQALSKAVSISCRKKAEIVKADEKEGGIRALLNLGHTFGHALEFSAGFDGSLLHGEAVSVGMVLAFQLSNRMAVCDEKDVDDVIAHLQSVGLPVCVKDIAASLNHSPEEIVSFMQKDKKIHKGVPAFILVREIGEAFVSREVDLDDVLAVIKNSLL